MSVQAALDEFETPAPDDSDESDGWTCPFCETTVHSVTQPDHLTECDDAPREVSP